VLAISNSQFTKMGEASFIERMKEVLLETVPAAVRAIPPAELDAEILRQVHRADTYGLRSEASAAIYVVTAWMLGLDFNTRFEDVHATLGSRWLTQAQKSEWLQSFTVELLKALSS
jgi:hypothetical protein